MTYSAADNNAEAMMPEELGNQKFATVIFPISQRDAVFISVELSGYPPLELRLSTFVIAKIAIDLSCESSDKPAHISEGQLVRIHIELCDT